MYSSLEGWADYQDNLVSTIFNSCSSRILSTRASSIAFPGIIGNTHAEGPASLRRLILNTEAACPAVVLASSQTTAQDSDDRCR